MPAITASIVHVKQPMQVTLLSSYPAGKMASFQAGPTHDDNVIMY